MIKTITILTILLFPHNGITQRNFHIEDVSQADSLYNKGNAEGAIQLYQTILKDQNPSDSVYAMISERIGDIQRSLNLFKEAYQNYIFAIEKQTEAKRLCVLNMKAGSVCGVLEQYDQSVFHFNTSLNLANITSDQLLISQTYNNLGLTFLNLNDFVKAKQYLLKSYQKRLLLDTPPFRMAIILNNLGLVYEKTGLNDSAYLYYKESYKIRTVHQTSDEDIAQSLQNIGYIKQLEGEPDSAYWYYNSAKKLIEGKVFPGLSNKVYGNLMEYFWDRKKYDSVRFYLDKFSAVDKDYYDEVTGKEVINLNTKYRVAQKDKQIDSMGSRLADMIGQRNLLVFGTILLLISSILLFMYLNQRQKSIRNLSQKNEEILHQKINEILRDEELKSINAMLAGQENERKRIAEDLHDRLGSKLAAVKLHFESIAHQADDHSLSKKLSNLIDEAVTDVRAIAHNMLSGVLDKFGLVAALKDLTETINLSDKLSVKFISHGIDDRFSGELELNLYRIIQELLANVLKHSEATEVIIQLNKFDDELVMTVEDNGIGFNVKEVKEGVGLKNIASRVDKIGGRIHIDSGLKNGTSITIEIDLI